MFISGESTVPIEAERIMHYEVLFLALTTSLLNLRESLRDHAFSTVESSFEGLEFRKIRVPGHTSVGARTPPDSDHCLYDWIRSLHQQGLQRAGVPIFDSSLKPGSMPKGLSPMQQQAFQSGSLRLVACEFETKTKYYVLEMESSAPHMMSSEKFGDMLADQPAADAIWSSLLKEVIAANQSEVSDSDQMREYFYTRSGARAFAANGDAFLLAAQSAAQRVGSRLVISEIEEEYFSIGDNAESLHVLLGGVPEEFIAFEDLLILKGAATVSELARLFDAQTCGPAVWERVSASLVRIGEFQKSLKPADTRRAFLSLDQAKGDVYTRSFIQAIQEACRSCSCHVRIPEEFNDRLQTYLESLDPEARAGHVPADQQLHFVPNREPWNHFYFSEVGTLDRPSTTEPPPAVDGAVKSCANHAPEKATLSKLAQAMLEAQQAMRLGYAFAMRIGSEYAKTFALVNMVLSPESEPFFAGRISLVDYLFELQSHGHDREMQESLESSWSLMELLRDLKLKPLQVQAICAASLADVFGGIGDWNDSYFDDPADQKEFEEISQTLFRAVQSLQMNALAIHEMGRVV